MDWTSIMWAGALGAAGAVAGSLVGTLLSFLFPKRLRPGVITVFVILGVSGATTFKQDIQQALMTPDRFERMVMGDLKAENEGTYKTLLLYKEHVPELYRSIMEKASNTYKEGKGTDTISNIIRMEITNYAHSRVRELSDDGILQMAELVTRQLEQLAKEGQNETCIGMMRGEQLGAVNWSDEMTELEYQLAQVLVLDSGGSGEVATQETVQEVANRAVAELMKVHGQAKVTTVFGAISERGAAPEESCKVFADYFRILKKAAAPEEAPILRAIFTAES